jgi:hypothetical protein
MTDKLCHKCGRWLPPDKFPLCDGYRCSPCKDCVAMQKDIWRRKNQAQVNKYSREYRRHWKKLNPGYGRRWKKRLFES